MKVAIYGKSYPGHLLPYFQLVVKKLEDLGYNYIFHDEFYEYLKAQYQISPDIATFSSYSDIADGVDFLLSIGGDGTFLDTITFVRNSGIPILGINLGRLGFLSSIAKEEISDAIDMISTGRYTIESRSLLRLESEDGLFGELNYGLNEFTIYKKVPNSMIAIKVYVDDIFLNSYWADGLIVSTPTGSTAYSMSCGGPIIAPGCSNFVITPIASHNLTVRPIVIPDSSKIRISADGRSSDFFVSLDSRMETVKSKTELLIQREEFSVNLVQMNNENFFRTIREKLMWGLDKRN